MKKRSAAQILAVRFVILCYQIFDVLELDAKDIAYRDIHRRFRGLLDKGVFQEKLPEVLLWSLTIGGKAGDPAVRENFAKEQASRFCSKNKDLIAEWVLST